jgi:hypothetical protein
MRTASGFDRIATEEELHQVLAVLQETPDGWVLSEDFDGSEDSGDPSDEAFEVECLAELAARRPELKN